MPKLKEDPAAFGMDGLGHLFHPATWASLWMPGVKA